MDKSWRMLESSFKKNDDVDIDWNSSSSSSDSEIQPTKRLKTLNPDSTFSKVFCAQKRLQSNSKPIIDNATDIKEMSSDDMTDLNDISPSASPPYTEYLQSHSTLSQAFATKSEPKLQKRRFVKDGLAMKLQTLLNRQKYSKLSLNFTNNDLEDESTLILHVDKITNEFGKTLIQSKDDIILLTSQQSQLYKVNDKLKIVSPEFISIKPLEHVLNVHLNIHRITSENI